MTKLKLAEAYPLGEFIKEELEARGWTVRYLAIRMGGSLRDIALNELATEMLMAVPESRIDEKMAEDYARAFEVSAIMFLNLDRSYHEWREQQDMSAGTDKHSSKDIKGDL